VFPIVAANCSPGWLLVEADLERVWAVSQNLSFRRPECYQRHSLVLKTQEEAMSATVLVELLVLAAIVALPLHLLKELIAEGK
jgi:hypothetical protein